MAELHHFRVVAWWTSGRSGFAKSDSAPNAIHFAAPPAFGGLDGRWTPEDLLLCAVASCYTATFRALAENSKFKYTDLQVEANGTIVKVDVGYALSDVFIRAILIISEEQEEERAMKLLQKTQELCLVSRALSVEPKFETCVQVVAARNAGQALAISSNEEVVRQRSSQPE